MPKKTKNMQKHTKSKTTGHSSLVRTAHTSVLMTFTTQLTHTQFYVDVGLRNVTFSSQTHKCFTISVTVILFLVAMWNIVLKIVFVHLSICPFVCLSTRNSKKALTKIHWICKVAFFQCFCYVYTCMWRISWITYTLKCLSTKVPIGN